VLLGGFQWFAGYLSALRAHADKTYGQKNQVILLDAGDAAQGTLLSNFSEGVLAIKLMNEVGYTAAIPGNHAYDFGPVDWQVDSVPAGGDGDPLGALRTCIKAATFPFLGANVTTSKGKPLPELPPYTLVPVRDKRKVAVIGLENPATPATTVRENVEGLKFTSGVEELKKLVEELSTSGKADVFVLVMHEGDGAQPSMRQFLKGLPKRADGQPLVDAVIAGHSHFINDADEGGIPYVQSSANGRMFGVIQLVLKKGAGGRLTVLRQRTRQKAGIRIEPKAGTFLGEPVKADAKVLKLLEAGRKEVEGLASRELCTTPEAIPYSGGRTSDSEMGNLLADMMRQAAGTDIAVINSGDVRTGLPSGTITYEHLFGVVPKNIQLLTIAKLPIELLVKNMHSSIESCGRRGALQFSGITVEFKRDCKSPQGGVDPKAQLSRIVTTAGKVLYERKDDKEVFSKSPVSCATTDFIMSGGAGYQHFKGLPTTNPLALRDAVADQMVKEKKLKPAEYAVGRYKNLLEH
jgi:5'-nucleotidase/UDP-sugar diphosphatase